MRLFIILLLLGCASEAMAQQPAQPSVQRRVDNLSEMQPQRNIHDIGFDSRTSSLRGSEYLSEDWEVGAIRFKDDTAFLENLKVRYNLLDEALEIKSPTTTKVATPAQLDDFFIVGPKAKRLFISGRQYKHENGEAASGFYEVLQDGEYQYLRHVKAHVSKPNYTEAFNMGSRDYIIEPTTREFIAHRGVLYPVTTFFANKRKSDPSLKKFIRINDLSIKDPVHITQIIDHLNQQ